MSGFEEGRLEQHERKNRVLVVGADASSRQAQALESAGFVVDCVASDVDASEKQSSGLYSTIVHVCSDGDHRRCVVHHEDQQTALLEEQAKLLDVAHVLIRDDHDRIVTWNSGAESLYGYSRAEALGRISHELLQTVFPKPLEEIRADLLRAGQWTGELVHTSREGEKIVVSTHWALHRDRDGSPTAVVEVNNDITMLKVAEDALQEANETLAAANEELAATNEELVASNEELRATTEELNQEVIERELAEKAARESEEMFRTMADAIPQLAWMADPDGSIFWYNTRWYEYTGTTPEQMQGWGWQSVHDPEVLPRVLQRWKASIATGEPFDMEFPLLGADGKFRPFLTRVMPLKDSEGRVMRWFGTNTDVSEARELEAHKLEFYKRTILAATEGKLVIAEKQEIDQMPCEHIRTWQIGDIDAIARMRGELDQFILQAGMDSARAYEFLGCVMEAAANATKHANGGQARLCRTEDALLFVVSDGGPGIGALALPDVALTRNYSTAGTLGMGYKLMIKFADKVYLSTGPEGTTVAIEVKPKS